MQIDLSPAEAGELLEALTKRHAVEEYTSLVGIDADLQKSAWLFLLFAKLIQIAKSGPKRAPLHK